jgi:hypothetical protein
MKPKKKQPKIKKIRTLDCYGIGTENKGKISFPLYWEKDEPDLGDLGKPINGG